MMTTIDRAGRVVVPRFIRERLHLLDGGKVEVTERAGIIEISPVDAELEIVQTAQGPVAVPAQELPMLTDEDVRITLESVRR